MVLTIIVEQALIACRYIVDLLKMDSRNYYLWSEEQIHKSRGLDVWWLRRTPKILASVLEVRKCGVPTPGQGLIAAPSGGVKVSRGLVHK